MSSMRARLVMLSLCVTASAAAIPRSSFAQQPAARAAPPATAGQGKLEILWLGQAAMRITTVTGKVIVIDPFLTKNPKTPERYKHLEALGKVDLVLVTHAHGDHMGDAAELVKKTGANLWAPAGLSQQLITLGVLPAAQANRMSPGGSIQPFGPGGVKITMVHAEHNSELVWHNPATDKDETHYGGQPCGYIIELESGLKIYHMGDTGLFGDMKLIGDYYKPDLVLAPIGGGQHVMSPADAAYAVRELLHPKYVLPFHYGTFAFLPGTPAEFQAALGKAPVQVFAIAPGEKLPL